MKRKITQQLIEWKYSPSRKPLILNGARQVGKTFILREFGKQNYKNTVYINLESNSAISSIFNDNISPSRLIKYLETETNERILPNETLIILDEIQSCERAVTSLKYFCEEAPEYHIVAAGSLLGVAIKRNQTSFPVGKVNLMRLYPLDFEEFLTATGSELLIDEITDCFNSMVPMNEALHKKTLDFIIVSLFKCSWYIYELFASYKTITATTFYSSTIHSYCDIRQFNMARFIIL